MADTAHYAHCRTLLAKFKRTHLRRLILLATLLVLNFYVHVLTFGVKYGGPSFEAAKALGVGVSMLPFGMGMATLICSVAALVMAFFAEVKRPKLMFCMMGLILLCGFADFIHWLIVAAILIIWATQIKDLLNYRWVKEQPGFPHFSERFEEQLENTDYKPMHQIDGKHHAEMSGIAEGESDDFMRNSGTVMPDVVIPDAEESVFSETNALPEENFPAEDTQASLTDTSVILSDPMADFPELPDIPDIPKL